MPVPDVRSFLQKCLSPLGEVNSAVYSGIGGFNAPKAPAIIRRSISALRFGLEWPSNTTIDSLLTGRSDFEFYPSTENGDSTRSFTREEIDNIQQRRSDTFPQKFKNDARGLITKALSSAKSEKQSLDTQLDRLNVYESELLGAQDKSMKEINTLSIQVGLPLFCLNGGLRDCRLPTRIVRSPGQVDSSTFSKTSGKIQAAPDIF